MPAKKILRRKGKCYALRKKRKGGYKYHVLVKCPPKRTVKRKAPKRKTTKRKTTAEGRRLHKCAVKAIKLCGCRK